jgi:leader peptidase (prepilin peptidase)/N-methyltransferase
VNASAAAPGLWVAFAALSGAVIGSFLNVVIYRLPREESLVWPGSRCPQCAEPIPAWANVPVVSWLALRGRCAACAAPIPLRYPLVEAATAMLFAALVLRYGPGLRALGLRALGAALVAVAFIDAEHWIIPDEITLPGIALGLLSCRAEPGLRAAISARWESAADVGASSRPSALRRGRAWLGTRSLAMVGASRRGGGCRCLPAAIRPLLRCRAWSRLAGRRTRIPFGGALAAAGILLAFEPRMSRLLIEALAARIAG